MNARRVAAAVRRGRCATAQTTLLCRPETASHASCAVQSLLQKDPMNPFPRVNRSSLRLVPAFALALAAGCSGGLDPILGNPGAGMAPAVTATVPAASVPVVTGTATNSRIQATFSKPMLGTSLTPASFSLACPAGTPVSAAVSYDAPTQTATLTPTAVLPLATLCTATLSTAVQDTLGFYLASSFSWSFMTTGDAVRPTVIFTVPAALASAVATNSAISASFSKDMNPATLTASSFLLTNTTLGSAVAGSVSYSVSSRTALFTPSAAGTLASNSSFSASITAAAADLAGNGLAGSAAALPGASNYAWTFSTGGTGDSAAPTVTATSPVAGSVTVCLTKTVSATFNEPMNAGTINTASFVVTDNGVPVAGTVSYDALQRVASFNPSSAAGFAATRTFVVTIKSGPAGVRDLAGNALAADRVGSFATGTLACGATGGGGAGVVNLGTAAAFGAFGGGAGVTNQGINTVVNGNLATTAACSLITGLHDGTNVYTQTPLNVGVVNGSISCGPPAPGTVATLALATQARADAQAAYNALAAMAPGSDPGAGQLGGLVLAPAVYTSAGGTFAITSGDLTLDAQNDPNATWVFQSAAALTVGLSATPRRVLLVNGAKAANVYWQVGSAARIEDGSAMVGTIIAPAGVTISTAGQTIQTTLIGRALGLTASVTLVNTTIVAP